MSWPGWSRTVRVGRGADESVKGAHVRACGCPDSRVSCAAERGAKQKLRKMLKEERIWPETYLKS